MRQTDQEYQEVNNGSRSSSGSNDSNTSRRSYHLQPFPMRSSAKQSCLSVPAFSIRSIQTGIRVQQPPRVNVFAERPTPSLAFRRIYNRGDLPVCIVHESRLYRLGWKVELDTIDYEFYLPLFLDGLCETKHPHEFLARKGAEDLIQRHPDRVTPLLPAIISPLRRALNTRNPRVICSTLKIIQLIANCSKESGRALLPYYKCLLPILNLFKTINLNKGDGIDYSQQKGVNIGDLVQETLEVMEKSGGKNSFVLIKNHIPTYESCVLR